MHLATGVLMYLLAGQTALGHRVGLQAGKGDVITTIEAFLGCSYYYEKYDCGYNNREQRNNCLIEMLRMFGFSTLFERTTRTSALLCLSVHIF